MKIRSRLLEYFGQGFYSSKDCEGVITYTSEISYPWVEETCHEFYRFFSLLKEEFHFYLLMDISYESRERDFQRGILYYQLLNLEDYFRLTVKVQVSKGPFIPGLGHLWKSASTFEKELEQRYSLIISDGVKSKQWKLLRERGKNLKEREIEDLPLYRIPLDPGPEDMQKKWHQVGPLSSPLKGRARLDFLLYEDRVDDCRVLGGFCSRNFENHIKTKDFINCITFMERLCSRDSIFAPLLWVESIESRFSIDVPERAQAMRMVWMELARIEGHLYYLLELCHDLGFHIESSSLAELLEQIYHLYTLYGGKVQNFSVFTYGGVLQDFPTGWTMECLEVGKYLQRELSSLQGKLMRNMPWMEATSGCSLSASEALDYSFSGPNLRACGVNYDLRKRRPRYFYEDVDFEVPLGIKGNTYDRFLVRSEEIKQSIKIINQVLDHLPIGNHKNKESSFSPELSFEELTRRGEKTSSQEENTYTFVESTEGELGLCLTTDQNNKMTHFHLRSPSYVHLSSYPQLVSGEELQHALTAFLSLGIDAWEMDR